MEMTEAQRKKVMESPAFTMQSKGYPEWYQGKVPFMIRMERMVAPDFPFSMMPDAQAAENGMEYPCWVNSQGAIAVVFPDGSTLGVKPNEITIVSFHA